MRVDTGANQQVPDRDVMARLVRFSDAKWDCVHRREQLFGFRGPQCPPIELMVDGSVATLRQEPMW